jgi:ribosome recycling factor
MVFPELNEERRKILAKDIKVLGEGAKVAIRNIRRDVLNKLRSFEKDKTITEDDLKIYEKDLDKQVNEKIFEIEKIIVEKEAEVMSV